MSTRTIEIMVGLFVAIGIAALFMLAMKVSNLATYGGDKGYTITAEFDNIGGLKVRSLVSASFLNLIEYLPLPASSSM